MNPENRPEQSERHPMWEGAIVGFLFAAESGLIPEEEIIPSTSQVCLELLQSGMLTDLGELQGYLRGRESFIQLVARPFKPEEMSHPGIRCADAVTGEPRGHWLMISLGTAEAAQQLQDLAMSDEVNETTLTHDTGMLMLEPGFDL